MLIFKNKNKEKNYVQIDNITIDDNKLSWGATGLLTYLLSKPENWEVCLEQLKNVKSNGRDGTRSLLLELRKFNYCHLFEIREKGVFKKKIYLVFEVPTSPTEAIKKISVLEGEKIYYQKIKVKKEEKTENPKMEKAILDKPIMDNTTQIITDSNNNILTNKTTTKNINFEKEILRKNSSSYDFLNLSNFSLLNQKTKSNINRYIDNLSREKFEKIYKIVREKFEKNEVKNFNAYVYQALLEDWKLDFKSEEIKKKELDQDKKEWLNRYSGIINDLTLKKEIENIIIDVPLEILKKEQSFLGRMSIPEFRQYLYTLKKRIEQVDFSLFYLKSLLNFYFQ